jgi:hypothetical protein
MSAASLKRPASTNCRTREVRDALHALLRALDVHAVVVGLTFEAHEWRAARRALLREDPLARASLALGQHRTHHLRDHVARLAHDHGVARAHVLARHLVLVVEGGEADG